MIEQSGKMLPREAKPCTTQPKTSILVLNFTAEDKHAAEHDYTKLLLQVFHRRPP